MTKASTRTASISEDAVAGRLRAAGFELAPAPCATLTAYLELLAQWNRVFNLTGIRSREALVQRHVVESLTLGPLLRGGRVADVGTGAGLPGIPLAITAPEREFTLIESRAKRVRFLRHVVSMLGLDNARVEHCRVEDLPSARPFDTVLARAVAPPEELIRIARPLMACGGVLLVLTAAHLGQELRGLAPGLGLRPVAPSAPSAEGRIRSVIVALERPEPGEPQ
ncbi:16S rRNA (guanine(527)-N(7))-methyltransferase RsmG [Candidatus Rariloculus sp.]|uniref:16S rRNA (guanine(527)-N(7))-methyltransferase RsmG n=1 Tax=Candidatus Rariloculus sp. TaxID=3101265 RepID=UPI003D0BCFE9